MMADRKGKLDQTNQPTNEAVQQKNLTTNLTSKLLHINAVPYTDSPNQDEKKIREKQEKIYIYMKEMGKNNNKRYRRKEYTFWLVLVRRLKVERSN